METTGVSICHGGFDLARGFRFGTGFRFALCSKSGRILSGSAAFFVLALGRRQSPGTSNSRRPTTVAFRARRQPEELQTYPRTIVIDRLLSKSLLAFCVSVVFCGCVGFPALTYARFFPLQTAARDTDSPASQTTQISGTCFGPLAYQVTVGQVLESAEKEVLQQAVQNRLDEINGLMSTYQPDSVVSRFNQFAETEWFGVDGETAKVVLRSLELSQKTDGAFDITVGPLVAAWKFGAADPDNDQSVNLGKSEQSLPGDDQIASLLQRVGYQKLEARLGPPALRKLHPLLQIDLSAIAKGYAVDEVSRVVNELGYANHFVEVGEEVRAIGRHPANRAWVCGIERPVEIIRSIDIRIPLDNQAIATSGDYRQFRLIGGQRYSHIIDPRTGKPANYSVALASVCADDCMTADAFATAFSVMGQSAAMKTASANEVGLHLVLRDADGGLTTQANAAYPKALAPTATGPAANWLIMLGATVLVFGLALAGMSIGVMFKRKPIAGSCGGLAAMAGGNRPSACDLCANPAKECRENGPGTRAAREAAEAAEAAS